MKSLLFPSCFTLLFTYGCAVKETPCPGSPMQASGAALPKPEGNTAGSSSSFGLCNEAYLFDAGLVPCPKEMRAFQITVETILLRLYRSGGNASDMLPKIGVRCQADIAGQAAGMGAAYYAQRQTIVLDEKLIRVCLSFGKDSLAALAFVIGHELVHHFQETGSAGASVPLHLLNFHPASSGNAEKEALADRLGLQLAHAAGYRRAAVILPKLLAKLYKAYRLPQQIEGYPSLKERQQTALPGAF